MNRVTRASPKERSRDNTICRFSPRSLATLASSAPAKARLKVATSGSRFSPSPPHHLIVLVVAAIAQLPITQQKVCRASTENEHSHSSGPERPLHSPEISARRAWG
ncbi:MAG: hypothetical protein ACREX4_10590 [Gammaproteobacteria bacterium]